MSSHNQTKSFRKNKQKDANVTPGTKYSSQNFSLLISTGLPALDFVLGGGLPVGSILLIEEDEFGFFSNLLAKYYVAEGIVCKQKLFIVSEGESGKRLIEKLPDIREKETEKTIASAESDQMRIAWRYENLKAADTTIDGKNDFGHNFDLSCEMKKDVIDSADIQLWETNKEEIICHALRNLLLKPEHIATEKQTTNLRVCRVLLHSAGSPLWDLDSISPTLYVLRSLLRRSVAVGLVTVPSHLLKDETLLMKWSQLADICIRLNSFAGTASAKNAALKDYHGLLHITKLPAFNSLAPHPALTDLAFKLRRRRLILERLSLPPELEDTSARGEEDSSFFCSSAKARNLDF